MTEVRLQPGSPGSVQSAPVTRIPGPESGDRPESGDSPRPGDRPEPGRLPGHRLVRGRRLWLLAFAAFFLLGAAWATATPYNGAPDEINHIIRAAGVARGEIVAPSVPGRPDLGTQHIRAGLAHGDVCWQSNPGRSAKCGVSPSGERRLVVAHTAAGQYPPLYYLLVGFPLALWPTWGGVLAARLLSVAWSAALLACAAYAAARWCRYRLGPAAVVVATTPITMHLAGGINPNGLEIAAGTAVFAALLPLLLGDDPAHRRGALWLAAVAGSVLALARGLSPLWLVIALGVLLVPNRRARLAALARDRAVRIAAAGLALCTTAAVAWLVTRRTGSPGWVHLPPHLSFTQALRLEVINRTGGYAEQMIGVMSWTDTLLPDPIYFTWYAALGLLFLLALAAGGRVQRWRLLALAVAVFAVPIVAEAASVNTYGFIAQGRYMLPVAVGVPLLAAWTIGERGALGGPTTVALARCLGLVLVPIQFLALWYTMIRWQHGLPTSFAPMPLNPFAGSWQPPLGPAVPLLLAAVGAALLLGYAWYAPAGVALVPAGASAAGVGDGEVRELAPPVRVLDEAEDPEPPVGVERREQPLRDLLAGGDGAGERPVEPLGEHRTGGSGRRGQ